MVIAAGDENHSSAEAAMATLCQSYWYPLYAFIRRQGYQSSDAQDLTQAFFSHLLEKRSVSHANRERGKFRTFLLSSLKNFLANERARNQAKKRGGGRPVLSLDFEHAESRWLQEPSSKVTAEQEFERRWATSVLDKVIEALRATYQASGEANAFEQLLPYLASSSMNQPYEKVAQELGISVPAVKTRVYRMRQRYRRLLQSEIATTVASPDDVDSEIQELFQALG